MLLFGGIVIPVFADEDTTPPEPPASEQGSSEQGSSEQGSSEQGSSEQGSTEQGSSEQGSSEQGSSEQGSSEQGSSEQGSSEQGSSEQGSGATARPVRTEQATPVPTLAPIAEPTVPEGYTAITTREELQAIAENPSGSYALMANIDMDGAEWTPIPFSGKLEGNGFALYNLRVRTPGKETVVTYDGNRKEYETVFGALFSVVTDAEITRLNLLNADIHVSTDQNCFLAAIAGYAKNTTFRACSVQARVQLELSGTNEGVGGLVGFSDESWYYDCAADAELTFLDSNEDIDCEEFMGGVFACGLGYMERCQVKTRGFAEIYGYAHGGGLVGMIKARRNTKFRARMVQCSSDTEISFFEVAPSKRCYCEPFVGEDNAGACYLSRNTKVHFEKSVSRTAKRIRPNPCEEDGATPAYRAVVTEPTCTEWGYTTYLCTTCDYAYTDNYTAPAHKYDQQTAEEPTCAKEGKAVFTCIYCGDSYTEALPKAEHTLAWVVTQPAEIGKEGVEQEQCSVCGETFASRAVPALDAPDAPDTPVLEIEAPSEPVTSLSLQPNPLSIPLKERGFLIPDNVSAELCAWSSDNPSIVSVDAHGGVTALSEGSTVIRCRYGDLEASATVTVQMSPLQWVRHYILFGWLWDK